MGGARQWTQGAAVSISRYGCDRGHSLAPGPTRFQVAQAPAGRRALLEEDAQGCVRRAASPQQIHGQVKIDVGPLREVARRLALVPDAPELLLAPEEDSLGFGVVVEIEFRSRRAHASGFGGGAPPVVPHLVDFESVLGMSLRRLGASWCARQGRRERS